MSTTSWRRRMGIAALGLVPATIVALVFTANVSCVQLFNDTDSAMFVELSSTCVRWTGKIPARSRKTVFFRPRGDGSFVVKGTSPAGETVTPKGLGYCTGLEYATHRLHIDGRGTRYDHRSLIAAFY